MFSFTSLATAAVSLASLAVAYNADLVARQDPLDFKCAPSGAIHFIYGGGCGIPCSVGDFGFIQNVTNALQAIAPGSNIWTVDYTNVKNQVQISTPFMLQHSNAYFDKCPGSPVVYLGYSLGGIIVGNMACGGAGSRGIAANNPQVLGMITLGSEWYRPGLSWDYPQPGSCQANAPFYPRNNTDTCNGYASVFREYCHPQDHSCCGTAPPDNNDAHWHSYNQYATQIASFVGSKFSSYTSSTSAASASATTTANTATTGTTGTGSSTRPTSKTDTTTTPTVTASSGFTTITSAPVVVVTSVVTTTRKACPANYGNKY